MCPLPGSVTKARQEAPRRAARGDELHGYSQTQKGGSEPLAQDIFWSHLPYLLNYWY